MYSQHNEEKIILDFFGLNYKGIFLDIGAYDGVFISNTYQLWKNGWFGIYVEPSTNSFLSLQKNITNNCQLFNTAIVADNRRLVKFYQDTEEATFVRNNETHKVRGISTISKTHVESWQDGNLRKRINATKPEFSEFFVGSCMIDNILNNIDPTIVSKIEFLDIDIEGTNREVAATIPLNRLTSLKLMCLEKEGLRPKKDYNEMFRKNFKFFQETHTNLFYVRA